MGNHCLQKMKSCICDLICPFGQPTSLHICCRSQSVGWCATGWLWRQLPGLLCTCHGCINGGKVLGTGKEAGVVVGHLLQEACTLCFYLFWAEQVAGCHTGAGVRFTHRLAGVTLLLSVFLFWLFGVKLKYVLKVSLSLILQKRLKKVGFKGYYI